MERMATEKQRETVIFHLDHGSTMGKKADHLIIKFFPFTSVFVGAEDVKSLTHFRQGANLSYTPRPGDIVAMVSFET